MRTEQLIGADLDYWVARAEELPLSSEWDQGDVVLVGTGRGDLRPYAPSTNWTQGGPIIEGEKIAVFFDAGNEYRPAQWGAELRPSGDTWIDTTIDGAGVSTGDTALIAAMRCYVASKFGDEVTE